MSDPKPWLDTPHCQCGGPFVPCGDVARNPRTTSDPSRVKCAACGKDHVESDVRTLARVWWSAGAWEGREETEREYAPLPRHIADEFERRIRHGATLEPRQFPRDIIAAMVADGTIEHERCALLTLEEWCDEDRYNYGVTIDLGWMEDEKR